MGADPMSKPTCPSCGAADPFGIEIQGVYDGVLFWACRECPHAWPCAFDPLTRRATIAREYAERWQQQSPEGKP